MVIYLLMMMKMKEEWPRAENKLAAQQTRLGVL